MRILKKLFSKILASAPKEQFTIIINGKKYDRCILCGKPTNVLTFTPANERYYYFEGAGQLHDACYDSLYFIERFPSVGCF